MDSDKLERDDLHELRSLLLNGDPEQVLNPQVTPEAIGEVLPAAIIEAQRQQPQLLASAVVTTVERAIHASVHRDSEVLSSALFPVIGPTTRKSIASAIGDLLQSLNRALEYSLSWQSLKWRLEARRTGKSFAEVVLLRTLIYQVEQVFLIHRETGLVLQHIAAETAVTQDPDLVSAMLTAIQDFARDSFSIQDDSVGVLEVGDLSIWLEEGPHATLACVIRGTAPNTLHTTMRASQEKIHRLFDAALRAFDGDARGFEASRRYLEACFQAQYKQKSRGEKTPFVIGKREKIVGGLVAACWVAGLVTWLVLSRQAHLRWINYVDTLEREPGIVVISHQKKQGRYLLTGLKDPLAKDPTRLLAETRIDADRVRMSWQPYLSLDSAFVSRRLQALLNPPPTVAMQLDETGVLRLRGTAPVEWINWAKGISDRTEGIEGWDSRLLIPVEWPAISGEPDRQTVYFNAD